MAVIGVGHLGKEHARILAGFPDVELVGVADVNPDQAQAVARRCGTQAFSDFWPLLNRVDAAVIAVPTTFHHTIAVPFLERGIALLVEKPLAATSAQAADLVALARRYDALLQVGHIERFNPAFEELKRRPLQSKLIECERSGPFTGRSTDIGVVLDLMIHDLDLLLTLVRAPLRTVDAVGISIFGTNEDVATAHLAFADGCVANVTASRASATPRRQMRIWAPEGQAILDFAARSLTLVQPSNHVRKHGLDPRRLDPASRALLKDQLFGRHLQVQHLDGNKADQLTLELEDFIRCVQTGASPRVTGEAARDAVALADRVLTSLRSHSWTGGMNGLIGPSHLPPPLGPLLQPGADEAAA
jgi:predicted dehydrogenase